MTENLWSLISKSFDKFSSYPGIKYHDADVPENCLSLTFSELFSDSDIFLKELSVTPKRSPVALLFPTTSSDMVCAYSAILAVIRLVCSLA
jgi:hypothetical protein